MTTKSYTNAHDYRLFDPDTAIQAAISNRVRRGSHRFKALEALAHGSLTDFELADKTGIQPTSIGKRRKELVELGFVEYAGFNRPSPTGTAAMVWRTTSKGFAFWAEHRNDS